MPENEEDRPPAEDYLAQLDWQSKQNMRRLSSRAFQDEPDWKYKIIPSKENENGSRSWSLLERLVIGAAIGLIGFALYRGFAENPGEVLFFGIIFMIILTIVILAIRDLSTKRKDQGDVDE